MISWRQSTLMSAKTRWSKKTGSGLRIRPPWIHSSSFTVSRPLRTRRTLVKRMMGAEVAVPLLFELAMIFFLI